MDYETFGEHHWVETGIHDFLRHLPTEFLKFEGNTFMTISEAIKAFDPVDEVDCPQTITWADSERDLTAWLGNSMQTQAIEKLYALESQVLATKNIEIIADWRRLQASDHVYYMCTKWSQDGNVHAYFSPYESPYDAFISFCNALKDLELRVMQAREGSKHHGKANRT
jgi:alpha-amylase